MSKSKVYFSSKIFFKILHCTDKWKPHGMQWTRTPYVGFWAIWKCERICSIAAEAIALCLNTLQAIKKEDFFLFFVFFNWESYMHRVKKKNYKRIYSDTVKHRPLGTTVISSS